jgi:hypothetical protein
MRLSVENVTLNKWYAQLYEQEKVFAKSWGNTRKEAINNVVFSYLQCYSFGKIEALEILKNETIG